MMDAFRSDQDELNRLRRQDAEVLADWVARFEQDVVGFLARMTGRPQKARRLAQDAFLSTYGKLLRGGRKDRALSLRLELFQTVVSIARLELRRQPSPSPERDSSPAIAASALWHGSTPLSTESARVARALSELAVDLREVLLLHDAAGLSGDEAAEVLGLSPDAFMARLNEARLALCGGDESPRAHQVFRLSEMTRDAR